MIFVISQGVAKEDWHSNYVTVSEVVIIIRDLFGTGHDANSFIASYPKSGNTWVEVFSQTRYFLRVTSAN